MLRIPVVLLAGLFLAVAASALQQGQPAVVKVSAEELGKDFERNADAAVRKYLPPRAGTAGGVLINLTGVVALVDAKNVEVGLHAGPNSRIILHAKSVAGIKAGDTVRVEKARFRNSFKQSILIDCDVVQLVK